MNHHFLRRRQFYIRLVQLGIITFSYYAASALRFDFSIPPSELPLLYQGIWIAVVVKMAVFYYSGISRGWWRYAGIADLHRVFLANLGGSVGFALVELAVAGARFPRSIYFIDFVVCFLLTAGARFSVRFYYESVLADVSSNNRKGLLIYGAGVAGMTLVREIRANRALGYEVIGFLDDDPNKHKAIFMGVKVLGNGRHAAQIVARYKSKRPAVEEILIALPSATGRQMQEALANARAAGVSVKTVPGIGELLTGKVLTTQIREVSVLDLLGREPVKLDEQRLQGAIAGQVIMVTGAGGSIGSELCRQLTRFRPGTLILFEQAESDLFRIHMELTSKVRNVEIVPQVGDIRDYKRVEETIRRYSVGSIFHAAAYKHVPMMENHLFEAVTNNVLGTRNLVQAASRNGVPNFLMISSDKAINPTNIMGLTKRIAELIVNSMPIPGEECGKTKFVSVRFGNVLGSNGSVIPIFREQIAGGGPVTVTHPDVRRYFMTIPEAVQLVMQASCMGKGSEIFVLDMGEPVSIVELARNMIRLSGHDPDVDIEIRYTGLRQGEKLFEELVLEGENMLPTSHEKIKIFRGLRLNRIVIEEWLHDLQMFVDQRDKSKTIAHMSELVPEYQASGQWRELLQVTRDRMEAASA